MSYFVQGALGAVRRRPARRGMRGLGADSCPDGQVLDLASGQCIAAKTGCGAGFHLDAASGLCVMDDPGNVDVKQPYNVNTASGTKVQCKPGLINDASGRYCISPQGSPAPQPCPAQSFPVGNGCYACPPDSTWDGQQGCDCLPGTVYDATTDHCIPGLPGIQGGPALKPGQCPAGQKPDPFTGAFCVPDTGSAQVIPPPPPACPAGQVLTASGCAPATGPAVKPGPVQVASTPLLSSPLFWVGLGVLGVGLIVMMTSDNPSV